MSCTSTSCIYNRVCVPSELRPGSLLLFVAEAPGFREIQELRPLIGPAGKIFENLLKLAGTTREDISIANTVGCVDLSREDRRPLPAELDACKNRLIADIKLVQPKAIVTMGNVSQTHFFPGTKVSKVRNHIRNWNGIPVVATFHPAYALPHRSPQVAPLIVDDIKMALNLANGK